MEPKDQYGNRSHTDYQHTAPFSPCDFHGVMDKHARFLEENQLLIEEDWLLFVQQYFDHPDDGDNGWRGEYFGKMMRGACMTYQYTKSERLHELLTRVARHMLTAQDELGRFSSYTVAKQFYGWDLWGRKYVLLGFLHYLEIRRDMELSHEIVEALKKHLDYIVREVYDKKVNISTTAKHWNGMNSASILEPVVRMYNLTGIQAYLDFATYIVDFLCSKNMEIFPLALENRLAPHQYPQTKAYEMMSCFEGLLEYYRATGIEKWKTAVINFADAVAAQELSIIGSAGCLHEMFDHALVTQTDTEYTGVMQETCVTVTWMKLCNQLLMLTGDAKYADLIEKAVYNALYGAINTEKAPQKDNFLIDSYSPLRSGIRGKKAGGYKAIAPDRYYGCCVAICAAGTALPLLTAVTKSKDAIVFNYYEKGTASIDGTVLHIDTRYPADGNICITFEEANAPATNISLRIPGFCGSDTQVLVNGIAQHGVSAGTYLTLSGHWKQGDCIWLQLDMPVCVLRPLGLPGKTESKQFLAVTYGPLVMARDARISEVGTPVNPAETAVLAPCTAGNVTCVFSAQADLEGQKFMMMDYGSAGKTWSEDSRLEAWIKTNES